MAATGWNCGRPTTRPARGHPEHGWRATDSHCQPERTAGTRRYPPDARQPPPASAPCRTGGGSPPTSCPRSGVQYLPLSGQLRHGHQRLPTWPARFPTACPPPAHGAVDFLAGGRLLFRRRGYGTHQVRRLLHQPHDLPHDLPQRLTPLAARGIASLMVGKAGPRCPCSCAFQPGCRVWRRPFPGGRHGLFRQLAHFAGHDGNTASPFTRAGRLHGGVQRQQGIRNASPSCTLPNDKGAPAI